MTSLSKEELRNLMRKAQAERDQSKADTSQRVVHPCAKYSRTGELTCSACNKRVRNETLWRTHIMSAEHKQNATPRQADKRKVNSNETALNTQQKLAKVHQEPLKVANSAEGEATESDVASGALPAGFFDETAAQVSVVQNTEPESSAASGGALPTDFFDSQKREDDERKLERELETFQREIAGVIDRGELLAEADDDQVQAQRELLETDELLAKWNRVHELEKLVDSVKSQPGLQNADLNPAKDNQSSESSDSEAEDSEQDDFLDEQSALDNAFEWRSKH